MAATDTQHGESPAARVALWAIPAVAVAYIAFLMAVGFGWIPALAYPLETWVFFGTALLAVLLVAEVVLLFRGGSRSRGADAEDAPDARGSPEEVAATAEAAALDAPEEALDAEDAVVAPAEAPEAPPREDPAVAAEDPGEAIITTDRLAGRRVAEYSRPGKARGGDAIYVKTYVAVAEDLVLRVEEMVAERRAA